MSRLIGSLLGAALSAALLASSAPALAEQVDAASRAAARNVAMEGINALQQGNATVASEKLEKAYRVLKVPSVALWSARALVKQGKLVDAAERYREASRLTFAGGDQSIQEQAQKDAAQELEELSSRIPSVRFVIEGGPVDEGSVTIDDVSVPSALLDEERPVNPGTHRISATRGGERFEESVSLNEGEKRRVIIKLDGSPSGSASGAGSAASAPTPAAAAAADASGPQPSPQRTQRTLAIVAFGAGGLGLAVGAGAGLMAIGNRNELERNPACRGDECLKSVATDVESFRTLRTVSTIGFVAGGALAATGLVLWFTQPTSSQHGGASPPRLACRVSPGFVSLHGSFR